MPHDQLALARSLADGIRSFVVYEHDRFAGLGYFGTHGLDEYSLVEFLELQGARSIITGDSLGITKVYSPSGVSEHHHRLWYEKQSVESVMSRITEAAPQAPRRVLKQVLSFALHTLSPRKVGATLMLSLRSPTAVDLELMKPQVDLSALQLRPSESAHRAVIRHYLSQVDGATILNPDGVVIGTGAHLKCSEKSISLIRELKGTRHTSAKRFSYDFAAGLLITVSADGPVTVFSDGTDLAEIHWRSADVVAEAMRQSMPDRRDDVSSDQYNRTCDKCGKTSVVDEVVMLGWKDREEANCPVCGTVLETSMCWTMNSRIIKRF